MQEPSVNNPNKKLVPFALGFRPFFLLAGIAAVALMTQWLFVYSGISNAGNYYSSIGWHGHEMVFAYAAAVVAGFLLTAARNWTGIQTITGAPLALLAAIWLAGRLLPLFADTVPHLIIAIVDCSFLLGLTIALAFPLIRSKQVNNIAFLPLLLVMFAGNVLVHLQLLGIMETSTQAGENMGIYMVVLVMVIMGGRVIPFFTERGLDSGINSKHWQWIERLAPLTIILYLLTQLFISNTLLLALMATVTAVVHGVRLAGWYQHGIWRVPLLWVLHLGYGWLVISFILELLSALGLVDNMLALHALTAGGIGVLTLGMMARVALGHSGRPLVASKAMAWAFALLNLGVVVRILLPALFPAWHSWLILVSGSLWIISFSIFSFIYTPILIKPRADGQPG
ncbi:MAG: NnrS family protein [Gammaproteobacteria bacterium]|nr:NnrS family protein [Gammaproteobacteria bacterium]